MNKSLLSISLLSVLFLQATAKPRTSAYLREKAQSLLNITTTKVESVKPLLQNEVFTVMGAQKGFVILSNDDVLPEVLAIGDGAFSDHTNESFRWWLNAVEAIGRECVAEGITPEAVAAPDPDSFPDAVEPLVTTHWDQGTPYNNYCPTKNGQRSVTGCVATALAQVLNYHRYPENGVGTLSRTYFGNTYTANYGETTYDFANMLDEYNLVSGYNAEQADAVATLMLHCGLAVNMDYSPSGSGAYSDVAAQGMRRYFGIETAECHNRSDYSTTEWKNLIFAELAEGHPMYYSGIDALSYDGGHAFVCDGYNEQGLLHINWGWSGSEDGYYNMDLLNPSGYKFSVQQDIIIGLYDPMVSMGGPRVELISLDIIDNEQGKLLENIGTENLSRLKGVTVSGELNQTDLDLLKTLAKGEVLTDLGSEEEKGTLRIIDLSHATLPEDVLPDEAFKDCKQLRNIKLPRTLKQIGNYAFSGCTRLTTITSYTYNVPKMGKRCFENISASNVCINVIAGSSDLYRRNSQWKTICTTKNVTEFGTCIRAKNAVRNFGEGNPILGYQMIGQRVVGAPNVWTDATAESLPGTYTIYIEPGTITATENVVYVPAVLTVEGDITGIESVANDKNEAAPIYTLEGKRASSATQGLKIQSGKVVLVR
jgi:hypothetical protein